MSRTDVPSSLLDTTQDLTPEPLVLLYRIVLSGGTTFRISPKNEETWQGNVYDPVPCIMTDMSIEADGRMNRPKFTFVNPAGMFTSSVATGAMDNAIITRYRILRSDLDANNNFALTEAFRVSRVMSLNKVQVILELRDVLDGHNFLLPARAFYPPEFPSVSLR